jgi:hypothetical protein
MTIFAKMVITRMQRLDHTYQVLYSVRESLRSFDDATRYRLRKDLAEGVMNLEGNPAAYDLATTPSDEP